MAEQKRCFAFPEALIAFCFCIPVRRQKYAEFLAIGSTSGNLGGQALRYLIHAAFLSQFRSTLMVSQILCKGLRARTHQNSSFQGAVSPVEGDDEPHCFADDSGAADPAASFALTHL